MKKVFLGLLLIVTMTLSGCWWLREARNVARDELGPRALLEKYEYFKNVSASIDKSYADIGIHKEILSNLEEMYEDVSRRNWHRSDIDTHRIKSSELAGVKANCNTLVAEYNAEMAKLNVSFANVGDLPAGADQVLPKEYKNCT